MNSGSKRLPPDPRRKARFREIAREIVAKDRYNRKYGFAVDTAGAIAQALERAHRDGVHDGPNQRPAADEQSHTDPMEWALIPPRPREAFWSICRDILGRVGAPGAGGHLAPVLTSRGTPGWDLIFPNRRFESIFADRTIAPLVRLGLLGSAPDDLPGCLIVSTPGAECWNLFLQRGGEGPEDLRDI